MMNDSTNTTSDFLSQLSENLDLSTEDLLFADIASNIAVAIAEKRLSLGLTQKQFAEYLSVSQSMVSKWESADYNFTLSSLLRLAQKLDLKLNVSLSTQRPVTQSVQLKGKVLQFPPNQWTTTITSPAASASWVSMNDSELKEM